MLGEGELFISIHMAVSYSHLAVGAIEGLLSHGISGVPVFGDLPVHANLESLDTRDPLVEVSSMEVGVDSTSIIAVSSVSS